MVEAICANWLGKAASVWRAPCKRPWRGRATGGGGASASETGGSAGLQQAFFRNTPIAAVDDELYFTCLLNCAETGALKNYKN